MNSVQLHLALTHVPVILSFVGLTMIVIAFFTKNTTLSKTAYFSLLAAGAAAIPVFFTGEGAEEAIENVSGVSEALIERHEGVANLAMISIATAGLAAAAALFSSKWKAAVRVFKILVLILAITSGGLMAQTAHLGGQIRHTEIRGEALNTGNKSATDTRTNYSQQGQDAD